MGVLAGRLSRMVAGMAVSGALHADVGACFCLGPCVPAGDGRFPRPMGRTVVRRRSAGVLWPGSGRPRGPAGLGRCELALSDSSDGCCSGVTVCCACACRRRLRGQQRLRAAREGLEVVETARAALGSIPWVCCSCGLAEIVWVRLAGVWWCGARPAAGSALGSSGGGRW
eukprot:SAG22_NODE_5333_length_1034_cov_121.185027_1_plen_169_part_01